MNGQLFFGSLYSGVGAGELGLVRAGWSPAWFAERDPWRRRVLAARFPGVRCFESVEAVSDTDVEPVGLIYADPPSRDPWWFRPLWPIVERTRPEFLVLEAGLRCVDEFLETFARLGYRGVGVNVAYDVDRLGRAFHQSRPYAFAGLIEVPALQAVLDALSAMEGAAHDATEPEDLADPDRVRVPDIVEALYGLPVGWTCACGAGRRDECVGESSARLVAANEASPPSVLYWIGTYLMRALRSELAPAGAA